MWWLLAALSVLTVAVAAAWVLVVGFFDRVDLDRAFVRVLRILLLL